ncbi:MAG: sortase, partial [Anaerolineales bacterium]
PTLTATPIIRPVILPASHQPPPTPEGNADSTSDIPESLRPLVTPNPLPVFITTATPEPQMAVRITIPAIGVDFPVVHGVEWEQLKRGVGHVPDTGLPGQAGNVVLAGHNDVFGEPFRDIYLLQPGDEIIVSTFTQQFRYLVTGTRIVPPTEVSVMDPTPNPATTLISCWPYLLDTERIVVTAELQS